MTIALTDFDAPWRCQFKRMGIEPIEVAYEELVVNYVSTVLAVLDYLEFPIMKTVIVAPPRLQKPVDEITEEWINRYLDIKGNSRES